ncbi:MULTISPECIES: branched-chain amino acid ABC transporter permease [Halomonadaceae]|uniref:branched-chain amino acid ABC transporter permease n=1 Tax=Halomonadaceae TaxID=28256 RepID=UPI001599BC57|nr:MULTISPECIES: branched-chain amino acid ABC transporter permease [Halomonas]QJQ94154.1 branched-chain amino acid ABC transporter permease [Halomonas sp. PA5]
MMARSEIAGALLLCAGIAFFALLPGYVGGYGLSMAINFLMFAILATAWALFSGPTGYVSLATVAFFGIGAYSMAVLGETLPWAAVIAISATIAFVIALLVGLSTLRLRGVYFVIFSFGLAELIRQLVNWYESTHAGSVGRYVFLDISQQQIVWQLTAVLALVLIVGWLIGRSRVGFALRMIGDDETVALHCGINITLIKVMVFALSATFMAVVGAILAPRWTYLDPSIAFNPNISFQVLIMALLGGARRLYGPILGVIPMVLLFEYLSANFPHLFSVLLGITFLAIVYLVPNGVAGLYDTYRRKWRERGVAQPAREGSA